MKSALQRNPLASAAVVACALIVAPAAAGPVVHVGQPCKEANRPSASALDHGSYDALLKKYVDEKGLVAYAQWRASAADVKALDDYFVKLGCVDLWKPTSKASLLAYWINAYNAVTIKGILREYPTTSIMNHASKNGGFNIWKDLQLWADGKPQSLDDIEHKILRKMGEPKIHFGLVCAARGCPPLANRAYTADNVDKTLVANAKQFFAQAKNLKLNATTRTVHLSQLFQWYGSDFAATPQQQVLAVRPYFPPQLDVDWLDKGPFSVQYLAYDWALNDQAPKGE